MQQYRVVSLLVAMVVWCALDAAWAAETYRWSKVRKGGKEFADTYVMGVNDADWLAGNYVLRDGSGTTGSFYFKANQLYEFAIPDGVLGPPHWTWVEDVGKNNTLVGNYSYNFLPEDGGEQLFAFLYRYSPKDHILIDVPGAFWTFPFGVNDLRQVALGYFAEPAPDVTTWGAAIYDYATDTWTPVTVFDGQFGDIVVVEGLNNTLDMVGTIDVPIDDGGCHCTFEQFAWAKIGGQDHVLVPPEWAQLVRPQKLNDHGLIVGWALTTDGRQVGFTLRTDTGAWQAIPRPGWRVAITDVDNKGRMSATLTCDDPAVCTVGYVEGWWVRPTSTVSSR